MPRPAAGQIWDAETYINNAGFVSALGQDAFVLLAPEAGEAILDIGCGDGALTLRIAGAGANVVGLEPDPSLAARARERGLTVIEQDAHAPFGQERYDAVFSNAALHWMRAPEIVLANAFAALRPGGRLVAEQGGFGNVAAVIVALNASLEAAGRSDPGFTPWDFPTPALQTARLERAGFSVRDISLIPRPTPLPTGVAGWLGTFGAPFFAGLDAAATRTVIEDTERRLVHLRDERGTWFADYVRLRFVAVKPAR
ncbi:methyltransferase domain-containing protein [Pseudochelatococcus sp. B33]